MIADSSYAKLKWYSYGGVIALIASIWAALILGAVDLSIIDLFSYLKLLITEGQTVAASQYPMISAIVVHIRLPRVIAAIAAGSALALAGACTQGLFRNPLASPDILGVSAGSSFGAVIAITSGLSITHPLWTPIIACIGALTCAMFVFVLARNSSTGQTLYLILAGLALSSLLGGATLAVLLFARQYEVSQFVFWTMGGLEGRIWTQIIWPLPVIVVCATWLLRHSKWLNTLSIGDEAAHGLGMNVGRSRFLLLLCASVLTAMSIAIAGPIGFIGLMVPHLVRMLTGANHISLLPLSALFGAIFLLICDLIGRYIIAPYEIKAGIITAIVGGIYFLWLVVRVQKQGRLL
ncbi:iron ABC transporter [Vibrio sp. UCD-FRSSP16_10]|uniref:FecCD family ABC transporter permease n=1 Tax=unclassified Vibrio TaxID=2614977 RepID=UPI0007FC5FBE|nr:MULTISPECIES: iron ABC transporter permease [unclassified Vibrio]OBT13519.1 iron ABC transporter [Vibrio sp. UCD-FRSSP16_30]OBT19978.1 iron ABC transporter [Vibrio sp. UCD-FRSSP16_10]